MTTMRSMSASVSDRKCTISSIRFRNSGRKKAAGSPGRFDVMISTTLVKSTVRPWPSVRRPSSSSWSRTLNTSWWAFSISSRRTTAYGRRRTSSVSWPALVVADVAGRRADEPGDGVLLLVLAHVDADHGPLVVEQEVGQGAGQLGLAHAGGAEEQERADGAVGVGEARPAAADGVGHRRHRLVLADDPLVEDLLHADELGHLALHQAGHGDARPPADDLGHVLRVDLLLEHALRSDWSSASSVGGRLEGRLQLGDAAVAEAGRGLQVGLPLDLGLAPSPAPP